MTSLSFLRNIIADFADSDVRLGEITYLLVVVMIAAAILCFVVSEITRNYSQVDKLWSIMPIIYSVIVLSAFPSPRLWIMSILVTLWGLRLSWNFSRKGGYNIIPWRGEEDYRWKIVQQHRLIKGRIRFGLFNLLFISFYQHLLILLFSAPLLVAAKYSEASLTLIDYLAAIFMLFFIIIETIADNQRFRFHILKQKNDNSVGLYSKSLKLGFFTEGLWSIVRHPNFIAEQAIWVSFYLFSVAASGSWFNWTVSGAILLILLFIGSTKLTENISRKNHPGYNDYLKQVPGLISRIFGL